MSYWHHFPQFFVNGQTFAYVFVDGKFTKLKEIDYDEEKKKIVLVFDKALQKGQEITLPILADYQLKDNEQIFVEVER